MRKLSLVLILNLAYADEIMLDEVVVTERIENAQKEISSSKISSSHINDQKDLVKKYVGVGSVDGGRSGSNGFAMRGVDRNRISIKVDGVEASQSFNPTFFQKQGRISGSRSLVELENLSYLKIDQGSNSLESGNGALGGVVFMKTKSADDFIGDGKNFGFYSKTGYASKNREFKQVLGAGFKAKGFEGLAQYTKRRGHETKTWYGYDETFILQNREIADKFNEAIDNGVHNKFSRLVGYTRIYPDPLIYNSNAYLFKLGYRFNDNHFINFSYDRKSIKNDIKNYSTHASVSNKFQKDTTPYKRVSAVYEYSNRGGGIENLKLQLAKQEVKQNYQSDTLELYHNSGKIPHVKEISQNTQTTSQINLKVNTTDLKFFNTYHSFYGGVGYYKNKFINDSFYGDNYGSSYKYTLTKPIHTNSFYFYLGDYAQLSDDLSLNFGLRYDRQKVSPKSSHLPNYSKKFDFPGLKKTSSVAFSYLFEINYELIENLNLGYKFSSGFKFPSIQEAYITDLTSFGTPHLANPDLKKETSQNNEISLNFENDNFAFDLTAFYTRYKNYIELGEIISYEMIKKRDWKNGGYKFEKKENKAFQYQNSSSATIKGFEINSILRGEMLNLDGFFVNLKLAYQTGKKSDGTSLMAIEPLTALFGVGYENPKFSILLDARYQKAKSKNDTKYKLVDNSGNLKKAAKIKTYPYLSNSYVVWDLTTSWNISENFKVNFGVFNIFDKKYTTWDTIRESKENGTLTITTADNGNVLGWERLTSPGRNFSASFEIKF
ncbi:TonB-dependent hemoglobin/transferrin/lactoferrin family receptor [Campylobacter portucalensis]|uniref:TonB-dependent hemoglobin/transferrin/lactoferrin family receptor n=1 Tax=Campylobacter portucalensis TaxID=2608384 RepID=UPI0018A6B311|nr:TonB-dependent hemoglobin/transferrin/lactoferrin family receptor [Campylobacter portucalensis]